MNRLPDEAVKPEDEKEYFAQAVAWDRNMMALREKSERRAWTVAGVAVVLALTAIGTLATLMPLKTNTPFLVPYDTSANIVGPVTEISQAPTTYAEPLTDFFLAQYVICRESYSKALLNDHYKQCKSMTAPALPMAMLDEVFDYSNPKSHYARYGDNGRVEIKNVTIVPNGKDVIGNQTADVYFQKNELLPGETKARSSKHFLKIAFKFFGPSEFKPDHTRDWKVNPLGLKVFDYLDRTEATN